MIQILKISIVTKLNIPWKYFPQIKQAYTFRFDNETEHSFSKSKSKIDLCIVSR